MSEYPREAIHAANEETRKATKAFHEMRARAEAAEAKLARVRELADEWEPMPSDPASTIGDCSDALHAVLDGEEDA